MNSYTFFAEYYDMLMAEDFDYERIADYLENLFDMYKKDAELVCELACGTGNITIPLAKRGYDMTAVDVSADMLGIAKSKAAGAGQSGILFLNQDMTRLDLYGTMDVIFCMIDGINYIISPYSLFGMFKRIKTCFLEPGGVFIFDLSTEYKLKDIIASNTFIYNSDDLFYTWENRYLEKKRISDMYLTFFARNKNGSYRRFYERHLQRAYREEELVKMLKSAGFDKVDVYEAMSFEKPKDDSQRIVFAAR